MQILHEEIGLPIKVIGSYNDGHSLNFGYGMYDSDLLLHYIYYEGYKIGLIRKAAFLFKIPKYQKHISDERKHLAVR